MPASTRPVRPAIADETGQTRSLADGPAVFDVFGTGREPVLLGLGPDPAAAATLLPSGRESAYIECPAFADAMGPDWRAAIPAGLRRLSPADLTPKRIARSRFFLYRQNLRLFPSFWGEIWARIQLGLLPARPVRSNGPDADGPVLLARAEGGLLEPELARALGAMGRIVTEVPAEAALAAVRTALGGTAPALYLCVNGAGLDADGLTAALLQAAGVPVAVWFVDNPFHVLGRFRAPLWKSAHLFVTDDWFVAPLKALGARSVHHLPLAAGRHFFDARPCDDLGGRALFVGRSAFPDRDRFFAGCRPPEALALAAASMLERGERPDFGWWAAALGLTGFWPGKAARLAGCGAETAGTAWRAACLGALAGAMPLRIHGDAGWRELVPGAEIAGPVDYYGRLPGLYAGAAVTLGLTSLLLPHGLSQRHFDVFAAGGLLVTDATPGLALFPAELTRPVVFSRPEELGRLARALAGEPARRAELVAAWRECLIAGHTYEIRLSRLFERILDAGRP